MRKTLLAALMLSVCALQAQAEPAGLPRHDVLSVVSTEARHVIQVRIEQRLSEPELTRLAEALRARHGKSGPQRMLIKFNLAGGAREDGSWATATFSPSLNLTIAGLRLEDEDALIAEVRADRRNLLGAWLATSTAAPGRLLIYREGARLYAEWRLRNGTRTLEEVYETRLHSGNRRYEVKGDDTIHYLLRTTGELELRQKQDVIAVAEPIPREPLKGAAPAVAVTRNPVAAEPRPVPATSALEPTTSAVPPSATEERPAGSVAGGMPPAAPAAVKKVTVRAPKPSARPAAAPVARSPAANTASDITMRNFLR